MADKLVSVLELCISRGIESRGMVKGGAIGGRSAAFVQEWAWYMQETGDDPGTTAGYSRWAHVPERTAYRRIAEFKELFPDYESPAALAVLLPVKGGGAVRVSVA